MMMLLAADAITLSLLRHVYYADITLDYVFAAADAIIADADIFCRCRCRHIRRYAS